MQCNQLIRLVKDWYTHVRQETMAPARMMQFVDSHVKECEICREDPDLPSDLEKVKEYVMPGARSSRGVRSSHDLLTPDIFPADENDDELPADVDSDPDSEADGLF